MKVQETRKEQTLPVAPTRRLNLARVKQLVLEHREGLALLAKNDGPVVEAKGTSRR